MKKNLLLATLVAQSISAQIISYDNRFSSNGKYTITEASNSYYTNTVQHSDGSLYENATTEIILSKLNTNEAVDTTFGINGEVKTSDWNLYHKG